MKLEEGRAAIPVPQYSRRSCHALLWSLATQWHPFVIFSNSTSALCSVLVFSGADVTECSFGGKRCTLITQPLSTKYFFSIPCCPHITHIVPPSINEVGGLVIWKKKKKTPHNVNPCPWENLLSCTNQDVFRLLVVKYQIETKWFRTTETAHWRLRHLSYVRFKFHGRSHFGSRNLVLPV